MSLDFGGGQLRDGKDEGAWERKTGGVTRKLLQNMGLGRSSRKMNRTVYAYIILRRKRSNSPTCAVASSTILYVFLIDLLSRVTQLQ